MPFTSVRTIVKHSIVTGFTIAVALIWRDFFISVIHKMIPPQDVILYELFVAIVCTVLVIAMVYVIINSESEAEIILKKLKQRKKRK